MKMKYYMLQSSPFTIKVSDLLIVHTYSVSTSSYPDAIACRFSMNFTFDNSLGFI